MPPHIDFQRGGLIYAQAYHALAKRKKPDTVLIFGVAHQGAEVPFITTRKHFETPFGVLETDQELVDQIWAATDWDPRANEFVHRNEHSIEFQAVMLARLWGCDLKIVPILCGPLEMEADDATPSDNAVVRAFLDACAAGR